MVLDDGKARPRTFVLPSKATFPTASLHNEENLQSLFIFGGDTNTTNTLRCDLLEGFPREEYGNLEKVQKLKLMNRKNIEIVDCLGLEELPDFIQRIPLQKLTIRECGFLSHARQRRGTQWFKISHVPNIRIDSKGVKSRHSDSEEMFFNREVNCART
ncbi:hypothetical protein FEM48_Zijuj01G0316200 [Ziziphus jujuba var. spinosa]|uniref:Uncharacterized protein n=1 Tax=Ziziphus jujuba var. spinosa TaxID=714518 RepID=A0A978W6B2_ZIZJJ|nr:hypothetical protein FEM48_Zijuj01G0316200 [Ziziphus jujuba var. spinosa]